MLYAGTCHHLIPARRGEASFIIYPPEKALVVCVDEKSQIQALDRTQPGLPMEKGRCGTMTHDYKRNGTTCLFAALNVLEAPSLRQILAKIRHCKAAAETPDYR
jgi:hypothetical protein